MTLYVDPAEMNGTVTNIGQAVMRLSTLRDRLDAVHNELQSSSTLWQAGDADNQFESFRNRWKDEFEILGEVLGKFKDALTKAAQAYGDMDQALAQRVRASRGGPAAG